MATVNRFIFLAIAMVFHLVYIYSIFDIYFVSPIVSGMQLFQIDRPEGTKAPADRLVLFVGMLFQLFAQQCAHNANAYGKVTDFVRTSPFNLFPTLHRIPKTTT